MKRYLISLLIVAWLVALPAWAEEADSSQRSPVAGGAEEIDSAPRLQVEGTEEKEQVKPSVLTGKSGPDYIIGPGDILDISLWRDDALTKQVVVLPDGKIYYPLIGQIEAGGRTIVDLRNEIHDKLTPYVPEPVLTIDVKQVNSMMLYVIGRVNVPGRLIVNTNISVLQALSMAGGLNSFAKRSKIKILRQQGDTTKVFPFNYDEVLDGENLSQNITLQRGDVIVVP